MSDGIVSITHLFIEKEDGRSIVRLFSASPTPLEEKNLGLLFAVMEIESSDAVNHDILQVIVDAVSSQYYRSETFEVEAAFEAALQKTNQRLQEMIAEIGEEWLQNLNIVIGVQKGREVIFANLGRVISLMIHKGSVIDVLDTTKAKIQPINPVKIFGNVVTGELPQNATILFATETILDYLSKEKIKRILMDNKPEEAVEDFYSLLEEDTTNSNFAGIILSYAQALHAPQSGMSGTGVSIPVVNAPASVTAASSASSDSMAELMGKQYQTEELLSNSLWPRLRKTLGGRLSRAVERGPRVQEDAAPDGRDRNDVLSPVRRERMSSARPQWQRVLVAMSKGLWTGVLFTATLIAKGARALVGLIRKSPLPAPSYGGRRGQQRSRRSFQDSTASVFSRAGKWFAALSVLQKVFFVLAIVVLVVFAQSVVTRGEEKITKEQEAAYSQAISDIDLKINEGKASAIFDKGEARALFLAAREQLQSIPTDSKVYKERGNELAQVISTELLAVNNITTIEQPEVVLDYSTIHPDISIGSFILLGASMYGFDENSVAVYRGNIETGETSVTVSEPQRSVTIEASAKASPGTGIVSFSDDTQALFNPITESFTTVELANAASEHRIVDVVLFGVRLYTLDTLNSQIYRHRRVEDSFEAGDEWLASGTADLSNAVSFAIDGSIYVLKDNGNVIRLSNGSKDDFSLSEIDPTLSSGTAFFTDENSEKLYVLDASGQRLVVFGKDGSLVAQYTSPAFDNLKDLVVDEAGGVAYLLNGAKVFKVSL